MTSSDAYAIALRFIRLNVRNIYVFIVVSVLFGGWIVVSPDVNETEAYSDLRKVLAFCYTILTLTLLVLTLKFMVRCNAALKLAGELHGGEGSTGEAGRLFRPISTLYALFPMAAIIIVVNYIILIYVVDGGLF